MTRERPMAAVKALIKKDEKLLALKTRVGDTYIWTLPGGRVEYGEAPLEALHREIEEEVSLEVSVTDCVGMYYFFIGPDSDGDQVVLTVFEAEIEDGKVDTDSNPAEENIEGYQWLTPEQLAERTENESLEELVEEYGNRRKNV